MGWSAVGRGATVDDALGDARAAGGRRSCVLLIPHRRMRDPARLQADLIVDGGGGVAGVGDPGEGGRIADDDLFAFRHHIRSASGAWEFPWAALRHGDLGQAPHGITRWREPSLAKFFRRPGREVRDGRDGSSATLRLQRTPRALLRFGRWLDRR